MKTEVKTKSSIPLSKTHLICACLCASQCKEIEQKIMDIDSHQEDIAYAAGSVMSSIAFLESSINEIFQDYFYGFKYSKEKKSDSLMKRKSDWDKGERKFFEEYNTHSIIGKYKLAYQIMLEKELNPKSKESYENSEVYEKFTKLNELRNKLVHFKLKYQYDDQDDNQYEITYYKDKFKENPFIEAGKLYFPKKCLGAGCAEWAIVVSTDFFTMFSEELSKSNIHLIKRTNINKILQQYSIKTN